MRSVTVFLACLLVAGCSSSSTLPDPTAVEARGGVALEAGNLEEAKELFLTSYRVGQPTFLSAVGLARIGIATQDDALFERAQRNAMELAPYTASAHDLVGRTFLTAALSADGGRRKQRAALAARFFSSAATLSEGKYPGLAYHLGMTHFATGRYTEATPFFGESVVTDPSLTEPALSRLEECLHHLNRDREILPTYERLAKEGRLSPERLAAMQGFLEKATPAGS